MSIKLQVTIWSLEIAAFHLGSISSTFYACIFRTKVCSKPNSKQRKLHEGLSYEKFARKTLMKLTPSINFINVNAHVFCMKFWRQSWNISRKSCQKRTFVRKICTFNVDEIDTWSVSIQMEKHEQMNSKSFWIKARTSSKTGHCFGSRNCSKNSFWSGLFRFHSWFNKVVLRTRRIVWPSVTPVGTLRRL